MLISTHNCAILNSDTSQRTRPNTSCTIDTNSTRMNDGGSDVGKSALAHLATELHIEEATLKRALEAAFNIALSNGNPSLSLQIALAQMGYKGPSIYAKLNKFGRNFAHDFGVAPGKQ
jgi:hypothetical protein